MEIQSPPHDIAVTLLQEYVRVNGFSITFDKGLAGRENMDRDFHAVEIHRNKSNQPLSLRIYNWSPWCISLGKHQHIDCINTDKATSAGYDTVHRITGGRAVFHAQELTYSVATSLPQRLSHHDVYRIIHHVIHRAMIRLGANNIEFVKTNTVQLPNISQDNVACFSRSARYELTHNKKKFVGSAQRIWQTNHGIVLLQHGSILLDDSHSLLHLFVRDSVTEQQQWKQQLLTHSTSLNHILLQTVTFDRCAEALENEWTEFFTQT